MAKILALLAAVMLLLSTVAVANDDKVTICHHTGSQTNPTVTITVSENAWEAHQKHGDTRGPCPESTAKPTQSAVPTGTPSPTARPTSTPDKTGSPSATPATASPARTGVPTATAKATAGPTATPVIGTLPSTSTK